MGSLNLLRFIRKIRVETTIAIVRKSFFIILMFERVSLYSFVEMAGKVKWFDATSE
jgi:hypothetical protein